MATIYECLKTVVGLAKQNCVCHQEGRPADYNTSKSGLFIHGSKYSVPLRLPMKVQECQGETGWTVLERAREDGIRSFLTDFQVGTRLNYDSVEPFEGYLADDSSNYVLQDRADICSAYFMPVIFKGAKAKVYTLQLWIDAPGTYTVNVYFDYKLRNGDTTPEQTTPITVAAGKTYGEVTLTTPWEIDLSNDAQEPVAMYFAYDRQGGNPRNITFDCGCGNSKPWEDFLVGYGVEAATVSELYNASGQKYHPNGLRIHASVSCGFDWLCRNWDYDNDTFAKVMADTINLYCIKSEIEILLLDDGVNPLTLFKEDQLIKRGETIVSLIEERMSYLRTNVPELSSDCLVCKSYMTVSANLT